MSFGHLVKHGADIDFQGSDGNTRLAVALQTPVLDREVVNLVSCLLVLDASPDVDVVKTWGYVAAL